MLTQIYGRVVRPVARKFLPPRARTIPNGVAAGLRFAARDVNGAFFDGTYELAIQDALKRHLKATDVFYDIGANVGFFTVAAARLVGPGGQVHAFEPLPRNVETIRRNVGLNRCSNVRIHAVAVAASNGPQELLVSRSCGGASLTAAGVTVPDVADRIVVTTVVIDDLIDQGVAPPPTLVKIDVEGAELSVLRGMQRTLRAHRPVILYEVDDADEGVMRGRWSRLDELVTAAGYRVQRVTDAYPAGGWAVGHTIAVPLYD